MKINSSLLFISITLFLWTGCTKKSQPTDIFQIIDNSEIGIDFVNKLEYDKDFNVYKYRNYYNGGGVALGDINNDGLIDIYFTGNLVSNKLYLNKGNNNFEDITVSANVGGRKSWSTGVTMVDINGDSYLDIYVCNSGDIDGDDKENELFINNKDLTFTESAAEYKLNDSGFSTHASFFDYDKDGDLDVYLLNNSYQAIGSFNLRINERPKRDTLGGDKLLRNDNNKFIDVSEDAGIYGSVIGFGLGITVGDLNNDGWEDIYVSNDFFERDYLYINNQDATFSEVLTEQMGTISGASMGADMADINNDGYADIFVTEMLPSDPQRLKSVTTFEDWNKYQYNFKNGYHHQFTRNTLQYNNGNGSFSEVARYAGVESSDWSWGALFFDFDNDGWKDLFIANGIYQDLTNQDYLQYVANEKVIQSIINNEGVNYKKLIDIIPSNPIANHFYLNNENLEFDRIHTATTDTKSFSNGAAYGDLDNDGDLDLVVNNVNMAPFIMENTSTSNNYIAILLKGEKNNSFGIGSLIEVMLPDEAKITSQVQPARGFQSSSDIRTIIGIGKASKVNIKVTWPDGNVSHLTDQEVNQTLNISYNQTTHIATNNDVKINKIFTQDTTLLYRHTENNFSDFNRERLIYSMKSNLNPRLSIADLDNNGKKELIVSGSKGSHSKILTISEDVISQSIAFSGQSKDQEHSCIHIFDANGDGYEDAYVGSGGVDVSPFSPVLFDQLWINNGNGELLMDEDQKLPNSKSNISTSVATSYDFDLDGDLDLFVGERTKIGSYGAKCSGFILENDGKGKFKDITKSIAPDLINIGMINDAQFADLDGDSRKELVIVGEFLPISIFEYSNGKFEKKAIPSLENKIGWFNKIHIDDINNDGKVDIIAGNHGLNSRFRTNTDRPIKMYYNDFDSNGFSEGILTYTLDDNKDYPFALRHTLIDQLKFLKKRFPDYASYKSADITTIFNAEELKGAEVSTVTSLETSLWVNKGNFNFENVDLPKECQYSPIYAISTGDYDNDGDIDIIMAGNQYNVIPEAGIYDASFGVYIENRGNTSFEFVQPSSIGMNLSGQIRDIVTLDNKIYIARNNDVMLSYAF